MNIEIKDDEIMQDDAICTDETCDIEEEQEVAIDEQPEEPVADDVAPTVDEEAAVDPFAAINERINQMQSAIDSLIETVSMFIENGAIITEAAPAVVEDSEPEWLDIEDMDFTI